LGTRKNRSPSTVALMGFFALFTGVTQVLYLSKYVFRYSDLIKIFVTY